MKLPLLLVDVDVVISLYGADRRDSESLLTTSLGGWSWAPTRP
jgi:hypothetical protein